MSGVSILLDEATPLLARVRTAAQQRGLALVGGRAVGTLLRDHLVQLNSSRHKYGRNYYAQAAQSVTVSAADRGAKVSITQIGFRQRLLGGPINPTNGKQFLTIPAIPEAYGTRAGEWAGLKVGKAMDPERGYLRWALVRTTGAAHVTVSKKGKITKHDLKDSGQILNEAVFWLVRSVNQAPDPTVLPDATKMNVTATNAMETELARLSKGGGGN